MSEFLKFAFELISQIIFNLVDWVVNFVKGFLRICITGIPGYDAIRKSYFQSMGFLPKLLSILLILILIAIPVCLIVIIVKKIILRRKLKQDADDNRTLYKEIGRLNKQVLDLMDEKNRILALKTGSVISANNDFYQQDGVIAGLNAGAESIAPDPLADPTQVALAAGGDGLVSAGGLAPAGGMALGGGLALAGSALNVNSSANIADDAIASAAAAASIAAAQARSMADEAERDSIKRFPKLANVDLKYEDYEEPTFNNEVTLQEFAEGYRNFAASQLGLYYTPEVVRRFVAGMASSKILILEGISGTGKTSMPYAFSRYMDNPATIVSVQPSFRDRTELLGYFNEFSKRFNETEFLRALYEANYRKEPCLIVLDEMNLARIEYYFAEMLSVLEMPSRDEWVVDLVPTAWAGDPLKMSGGKITIPGNIWFVGTCNNDDSTFTITDKVYDRGIPIEFNERATAFTCDLQPKCVLTSEHLEDLFEKAKEDHPISEATLAKMIKLDQYLQTRFKLAFGNRIMKQMYDFIPVYVACGGTEIDGMDYIIARKVLKKFESQNVPFVRDEIKGLIEYIDKIFGTNNMRDSREYLLRIQNLY